MRSEGHFGAEHGLALKASALPNKQVIEISLEWLFGNVKYLTAQVHTVTKLILLLMLDRLCWLVVKKPIIWGLSRVHNLPVRTIRPLYHSSIGFFDSFSVFVETDAPPHRVFHFQFKSGVTCKD